MPVEQAQENTTLLLIQAFQLHRESKERGDSKDRPDSPSINRELIPTTSRESHKLQGFKDMYRELRTKIEADPKTHTQPNLLETKD